MYHNQTQICYACVIVKIWRLLGQPVIEWLHCTVCTVSLQPFEYDANKKYTHKFMVQSVVIPDSATQQEIDNLVICFAAYVGRCDSD